MPKNYTDSGAAQSSTLEREPTDAELLVKFRSRFANSDPDGWVITPDSSQVKHRRVSELVAEEKQRFLARERASLALGRAARERATAEEEKKVLELERARSGQSIVELKAAAAAYERWLGRRTELSAELAKQEKIASDLLSGPSADADLESLRAHSAALADAQNLVAALKSQITSWEARGTQPREAVRSRAQVVQSDLTLLHQSERSKRVVLAEKALEALLDFDALRNRSPYHTPALGNLAQAAKPVVEFDHAIEYASGHYSWNHLVGDGELLAQVERLTALHETLCAALVE